MPGASAWKWKPRATSCEKRSASRTPRQLSAWWRSFAHEGQSVGGVVFSKLFLQPVEALGLVAVARTADVGDFDPGVARIVDIAARIALDDQQRACPGIERVVRPRADAGVVMQRRGLRHAERLGGDAAAIERNLAGEVHGDRAVALLI